MAFHLFLLWLLNSQKIFYEAYDNVTFHLEIYDHIQFDGVIGCSCESLL